MTNPLFMPPCNSCDCTYFNGANVCDDCGHTDADHTRRTPLKDPDRETAALLIMLPFALAMVFFLIHLLHIAVTLTLQ